MMSMGGVAELVDDDEFGFPDRGDGCIECSFVLGLAEESDK